VGKCRDTSMGGLFVKFGECEWGEIVSQEALNTRIRRGEYLQKILPNFSSILYLQLRTHFGSVFKEKTWAKLFYYFVLQVKTYPKKLPN
jgi:hypothetical protein